MAHSISVITATTGHEQLRRCVRSVQEQRQGGVRHCVVIDGPEHRERARAILEGAGDAKSIDVVELPRATGKDDWICHRIYGAMPFLVDGEWVCYLDEDNWFEPDHLESLMAAVAVIKSPWGFALRGICDADGKLACRDECESLGTLHPVFHNDEVRLVDTNCYLLRRDLAIGFSSIWNRPRQPVERFKPDFALCMALLQNNFLPAPSMRYSVNYTVSRAAKSAGIDYFERGNAIMRQRYGGSLPWEKPSEVMWSGMRAG